MLQNLALCAPVIFPLFWATLGMLHDINSFGESITRVGTLPWFCQPLFATPPSLPMVGSITSQEDVSRVSNKCDNNKAI